MSAIEKINKEMQKNTADGYTEIIGQYVIDRCVDPGVEAAVEVAGKTLKGAMDAVMNLAKSKKKGSVAVLLPGDVFSCVDKYFGIPEDMGAQMQAMCGSTPAPEPKKDSTVLNLADFL